MDPESRHRLSTRAVNLGLGANVLLALLKTAIGIVGHSAALLADGINSTSDVAYYLVVKVFIALSGKPPDKEHPYGHQQLESIAALVVGSFVITTAVAIFWDAINSTYDLFVQGSQDGTSASVTLVVALFTICLKVVLTVYTRSAGKRTDNAAIMALAFDHRNDVFSAIGVSIGIALNRAGYAWADPLAGALVAMLVLRTGLGILKDSSANLMDAVPSQSLNRQITDILRGVPGVDEVEEVQSHRFGPYLVVNVQIAIDGTLTVAEGDRIASQVEKILEREVAFLRRVYVHYHPTGGKNPAPESPKVYA